ncbi:MAG TPA: DUF998 domain-containing protein [Myxococcales bacterium]|nr:DUF998 domain-containing protein [Myxococcales bacterium]
MLLPPPPLAAHVALLGDAAFLLLVVSLHFLEREFDPSWRMLSEYSLGRFGWLMRIAFVGLGLGCLGDALATWPAMASAGGRVGVALLATIGLFGGAAAFFDTDPITTPPERLTRRGKIHNVCGVTFILGFPVPATLVARGLASSPAWVAARPWLLAATLLTWAGVLVLFGAFVYFGRRHHGTSAGPDMRIGWRIASSRRPTSRG